MAFPWLLLYAMLAIAVPSRSENKTTFDIPVTFNWLMQSSVEQSVNTKTLYTMNEALYSKVTVIDAAINAGQPIVDMMKKTISVVFLTAASSVISGTLKLNELRYIEKSKWAYTLTVKSIVDASNGAITKLSDEVFIWRIQESATKVLESRFGFALSDILQKLGMSKQQFYAVDDKQWIRVVGIIAEHVIRDRASKLNLTTCYLAEMINRTLGAIQGFTLNEVDTYIYNTSPLLDKLPSYYETVMKQLYQTFNITAAQFASLSGVDASRKEMGLKNVIQRFTAGILDELKVTEKQITESDSRFVSEILLDCTDKWDPFQSLAIIISFSNAAENMSLTNHTLSDLIEIPYQNIQHFTVTQMRQLLSIIIQPLILAKKLLEENTLFDVLNQHHGINIDVKTDNAFSTINKLTNFTERQLSIIYNWQEKDYEFAVLFSLDHMDRMCSFNSYDHTMLVLATTNVGQNVQCNSLRSLRDIWEKKSINDLKAKFHPHWSVPGDASISQVITSLTNTPHEINKRIFNVTFETEELLQKITLNNISDVTTFSYSDLLTMSFQNIIELTVHLHQNGSFDKTSPTSTSDVLSTTHSTSIASPSTFMSPAPSTTIITTSKSHIQISSSSTIQTTILESSSSRIQTLQSMSDSSQSSSLNISTVTKASSSHVIVTPHTSPSQSIQPSKTRVEASSSILQPDSCNAVSCKLDETCILENGHATCKSVQNLEVEFKITNQNFDENLKNLSSPRAVKLSVKIEALIDSTYQNSANYSSHYIGSEVINFKQGSIIVLSKLIFQNTLEISDNTIANVQQLLVQMTIGNPGNLTINGSTVVVKDFDECSPGNNQSTSKQCYSCQNTLGSYECVCPDGMTGDGITCRAIDNSARSDDDDVPWIIYVVIAIMVLLIIFLILIIIHCEKKRKKYRPRVFHFNNDGIDMYPRSTSYLAQTPESEGNVPDGLGIVNKHAPAPNMVTFNPSPEEKRKEPAKNGQPGVIQYRF